MRFPLLLIAIIIILQLINTAHAHTLHWFLRPYTALSFRSIALTFFLLSNASFLFMLSGHFRLFTLWFALLWIGILATALAAPALLLLNQIHPLTPTPQRLIALSTLAGLLILALYNAYQPTIHRLSLTIPKAMPAPVRLALITDLHLGDLFGNRQLQRLQQILSQENIDLLLIPGDIMDDNTQAFERQQMAPTLRQVFTTPTTATIATLGNHDLYQNSAYTSITQAITNAGALLLNDQVASITVSKNNQHTTLDIIGRLDDHDTTRQPTHILHQQTHPERPILLLDHRPSQINENTQLNIDLQVSGHTHKGQIFPANLIVSALNRVSYGHEQINQTHVLVSSGYGFWGIPLRLGSQSEIWIIDLHSNLDTPQ